MRRPVSISPTLRETPASAFTARVLERCAARSGDDTARFGACARVIAAWAAGLDEGWDDELPAVDGAVRQVSVFPQEQTLFPSVTARPEPLGTADAKAVTDVGEALVEALADVPPSEGWPLVRSFSRFAESGPRRDRGAAPDPAACVSPVFAARLGRALSGAVTLGQVANGLLDVLVDHFGASGGAVAIPPMGEGDWEVLAARGLDESLVRSIAPEGARSTRPVAGGSQVFVLPVAQGDRATGAALLSFAADAALPGAGVPELDVAVAHAALALDRARLFAVLEREVRERALAESAARAREASFRSLAENLPDLVVRFDRELRFTFVNNAIAALAGLTPAECLGRGVREAPFTGEVAGLVEDAVGRALAGERVAFSLQQAGPPARVWDATIVPERDERGEVVSVLGLARDVSELRARVDEARRRAEFEQQVVGIVSHDLRSPLSVICLSTETLLRREELPARELRVLQRMLASARRSARMLDDLLDFTRARLGGGLPITLQRTDLSALARDMAEEVSTTFAGRQIELSCTGDPTGAWDPGRLAQLLTNLLVNACTYGVGTVSIAVEGAGESVSLKVRNDGPRIPPELVGRVFEPLSRGEGARPGSRSIGLGLFIVRAIAEAHGGSVSVVSDEGAGTTFTVALPRGTR